MAEVVSLADRRPHMAGDARCMSCGHQWAATAPLGTYRLECPGCGLIHGAFVAAPMPEEGRSFWRCDCGSDLFMLLPHAIRCGRCAADVVGYP
jgi:hypothetical protein